MDDKTLLTLYVTTESALRCTTNLMAALTQAPPQPRNLEIIYVTEQPEPAESQTSMAIPCLKVERNGQSSFVVGDLEDSAEVHHALAV